MPYNHRPKTVVLHQQTGIGDLVWHIPYLRAVAQHSANDQIALIAAPTTLAKQLLAPENYISHIIDYYHLPRTLDKKNAKENRLKRMRLFAEQLKREQFERIVLFSGRASRGLLAYWSGIPQRLGYGYRWTQRLFLNTPPYISKYQGNANAIYHEATRFCMAHGFCDQPLRPKIHIPAELIEKVQALINHLPRPLYVLAIGSSEIYKQWGQTNYTELAQKLAQRGFGVLLIGGKIDTQMAQAIKQDIPQPLQQNVAIFTHLPILESAALTRCANVCIGNDTGLCQIAAACDCPCYIILGPRQKLDHDPLQHFIQGKQLHLIHTDQIIDALAKNQSPGF